MSTGINIMVLCNNEMAIPAMQQLYMSGSLKAVMVPEKNAALRSLLAQMLNGTGVSLVAVNKKNLEASARAAITEKNITTAWLMTFSYIIPKSLLTLLPGGFINFHYGLLPRYRGVNPVLSQMLNNETHGGITVHIADEGIDTGPIVLQQKIPIEDRDTFGIQLQKLGMLGASMAMNLLQIYRMGIPLPAVSQDETKARYYKKPVAADLMIRWDTMSSGQIIRLINACNPWNKGAGTLINNIGVCFSEAETIESETPEKKAPGTVICMDEQEGLKIYCFDNKVLKVNVIYTPEGFFPGKRLREYGVNKNDQFKS